MAETRLAFKAGRAFRRGNTNFVDPDPTKGAILLQNGEDGLLHFIWKNRTNDDAEEVHPAVLATWQCSDMTAGDCKGPYLVPGRRDFPEGRAICVGPDVRPQVLLVEPTTLRTSRLSFARPTPKRIMSGLQFWMQVSELCHSASYCKLVTAMTC